MWDWGLHRDIALGGHHHVWGGVLKETERCPKDRTGEIGGDGALRRLKNFLRPALSKGRIRRGRGEKSC